MSRIIRLASVAVIAGALSACASTFTSQISSFHQMQPPSGETVQIVPLRGDMAPSLEFAAYANVLAAELERAGYRLGRDGQTPDLIVKMDFAIDDGKVITRSYGGYNYGWPYYGGFGYYGWGWRGYYHPFWYRHHFAYDYPQIRSYTVYTRTLRIEIQRSSRPGQNIFESTIISEGRSNRLNEVVPLMIESLFTSFPGPSGVTRKVTLELDKDGKAASNSY